MIYCLSCPFAIKQYTFSKLGTLEILLMYELLGHFAMKMMNFSSIPTPRQVYCLAIEKPCKSAYNKAPSTGFVHYYELSLQLFIHILIILEDF